MYRSPIQDLDAAFEVAHQTYQNVACEILGITQGELDQVIRSSLKIIKDCTYAGYRIGSVFGGPLGGEAGAFAGTCVGVTIVVGAVVYRLVIQNPGTGPVTVTIQPA